MQCAYKNNGITTHPPNQRNCKNSSCRKLNERKALQVCIQNNVVPLTRSIFHSFVCFTYSYLDSINQKRTIHNTIPLMDGSFCLILSIHSYFFIKCLVAQIEPLMLFLQDSAQFILTLQLSPDHIELRMPRLLCTLTLSQLHTELV